jgi:hypothetical protein
LRGTPAPLDPEALAERLGEPLERKLLVPPLASLVLGDRADDGAAPGEQAPLLRVGERLGALDVEDRLDPGLRLLRVLAAGAARARRPELDLAERDREARCDPDGVDGARLASPGLP